jgi:hypothetical protein
MKSNHHRLRYLCRPGYYDTRYYTATKKQWLPVPDCGHSFYVHSGCAKPFFEMQFLHEISHLPQHSRKQSLCWRFLHKTGLELVKVKHTMQCKLLDYVGIICQYIHPFHRSAQKAIYLISARVALAANLKRREMESATLLKHNFQA